MSLTLDGTNGVTFPDSTRQITAGGPSFRNRIINGDMRIDQRNAGASVTAVDSALRYPVDRFYVFNSNATSRFNAQQNAGAITPPSGFTNYCGATVTSAYTVTATDEFSISQNIEGLNVADLGWGTANAQPITLSFWVRSSLTGTFGGSLRNSATTRSYPFSFVITTANTWEQKSITVLGDTTGTWLTTNGIGIRLVFSLGSGASASGTAGAWSAGDLRSATGAVSVVGTSGATFYITGVQLEKGTVATPFEFVDYGRQLAMCQRYFYWNGGTNDTSFFNVNSTNAAGAARFPVSMRATPTVVVFNGLTSGQVNLIGGGTGTGVSATIVSSNSFAGISGATLSGLGGCQFNYSISAEL